MDRKELIKALEQYRISLFDEDGEEIESDVISAVDVVLEALERG